MSVQILLFLDQSEMGKSSTGVKQEDSTFPKIIKKTWKETQQSLKVRRMVRPKKKSSSESNSEQELNFEEDEYSFMAERLSQSEDETQIKKKKAKKAWRKNKLQSKKWNKQISKESNENSFQLGSINSPSKSGKDDSDMVPMLKAEDINNLKNYLKKLVPNIPFEKAIKQIYEQTHHSIPNKLNEIPAPKSMNSSYPKRETRSYFELEKQMKFYLSVQERQKFKEKYRKEFANQNIEANYIHEELAQMDKKIRRDYVAYMKYGTNLSLAYGIEGAVDKNGKRNDPITYEELQKYQIQEMGKLATKDPAGMVFAEDQQRQFFQNMLKNGPQIFIDKNRAKKFFCIFQNVNYISYRSQSRIEEKIYRYNQQFSKTPNLSIRSSTQLNKLPHMRTLLYLFVTEGYELVSVRKAFGNPKMSTEKYNNFIMSMIRVVFRMIERFMKEFCGKKVKKCKYDEELILLLQAMIRPKLYFNEKDQQTFKSFCKVIWIIYDFDNLQMRKKDTRITDLHFLTQLLSKTQIIIMYYRLKSKIQEFEALKKQVSLQKLKHVNKLRPIQVKRHVEYIKYDADSVQNPQQKVPDPINYKQGIYEIEKIYAVEVSSMNQPLNTNKLPPWTIDFQIEMLKLYLEKKSIREVRDFCRERFKGYKEYEKEWNPDELRKKYQKVTRKIMKFIQFELRMYLRTSKSKMISFAELKFLNMTKEQQGVLVSRSTNCEFKMMVTEYYLNNIFRCYKAAVRLYRQQLKKCRNISNQSLSLSFMFCPMTYYQNSYIRYIVEHALTLLQGRQQLGGVLDQPEDQWYKDYSIEMIRNQQWLYKNRQKYKEIIVWGPLIKKFKENEEQRAKNLKNVQMANFLQAKMRQYKYLAQKPVNINSETIRIDHQLQNLDPIQLQSNVDKSDYQRLNGQQFSQESEQDNGSENGQERMNIQKPLEDQLYDQRYGMASKDYLNSQGLKLNFSEDIDEWYIQDEPCHDMIKSDQNNKKPIKTAQQQMQDEELCIIYEGQIESISENTNINEKENNQKGQIEKYKNSHSNDGSGNLRFSRLKQLFQKIKQEEKDQLDDFKNQVESIYADHRQNSQHDNQEESKVKVQDDQQSKRIFSENRKQSDSQLMNDSDQEFSEVSEQSQLNHQL